MSVLSQRRSVGGGAVMKDRVSVDRHFRAVPANVCAMVFLSGPFFSGISWVVLIFCGRWSRGMVVVVPVVFIY